MGRRALIVGSGFTGTRVALLLLERGWLVTATSRTSAKLAGLQARGAEVVAFDAASDDGLDAAADGASVLLSVPTLRDGEALGEPTPRIVAGLAGRPAHVTYLSTTGVYGVAKTVDEKTEPSPVTERQRLRAAAEEAVLSLTCPALVLRPAAIYGPNRGVHAAIREGRFRLSRNRRRYVSRIHVDDLAAIAAAAMMQGLTGAFPVADSLPAMSRDVALFSADLMGMGLPEEAADLDLSETRLSDRRVDGRAVLERLGLQLRYPTYREGIPACIAAERET